ncbi:hypothetical protein Vadar_006162 [Vaccinium darrowii]|uniref:Uncharacterized protein n=1 Tax=Vaccinium darrowii TaxID=229202 RepID=A0ACB7Z2V6_9ERIC|nr:hypothetical protein Vadar_006162 [Vaccinium darrowii]
MYWSFAFVAICLLSSALVDDVVVLVAENLKNEVGQDHAAVVEFYAPCDGREGGGFFSWSWRRKENEEGVTSVALTGQEMDQIEVIGDGIDAVALTTLLRKNVGYSQLVSVGPVPGENDDGSSGGDDQALVQVPVGGYYHYPYPYAYGPGHIYEIRGENPDNCCMM